MHEEVVSLQPCKLKEEVIPQPDYPAQNSFPGLLIPFPVHSAKLIKCLYGARV